MKNKIILEYFKRCALKVLLAACSIFMMSIISEATHFRYSTMSWKYVSGNTYQIKVQQAWRKSYAAFPNVVLGGVINTGTFEFGDGTTTALNLRVTTINAAEDWFYGEFIITKTYPASATPKNYTCRFTGCCRLDGIENVDVTDSYSSTTVINVGTTNNSPVSSVTPLVFAQESTVNSVPVTFSDFDGDALTYRLATAAEMGASTYTIPHGITINPATGEVLFNTQGYTVGKKLVLGVIASDGKTSSMVDFIITIVPRSTPPMFDYAVTPANGNIFQVSPGQPLIFNVKAFDVDNGSTVTLLAVGLPLGSSLSNPLPATANPVSTTFSWTPTISQFGTFIINFTAKDNIEVQTGTSVIINVSMKPVFDVPPTPAAGVNMATTSGTAFNFTVQASDPDPLDVVHISSASIPATASLSPNPSVANNPTSTIFSWNPATSDWGFRNVSFKATDSYNESTTHQIGLIVNTPPIFTSTPVISVVVNQPYSYLITGFDPDVPFGDSLEFVGNGFPTWLTLVDNENGTATLSGTPGLADIGTHTIKFYMEDIYHHAIPNGIPSQQFTITVLPCTISKDTSRVQHVTCKGLTDGKAEVRFNGGFGPFTYYWSNGTVDSTLSGVGPGTYIVRVTDAYNCAILDTIVINEPSKLTDSIIVSSHNGYGISCVGSANGSASVFAAGGVAPYHVYWSTGDSTATVSNLSAGTYTVTLTDGNGCIKSDSVRITAPSYALSDSILVSSYNGYGISCVGSSNGSASVFAAGGVASYHTYWSTGDTTKTVSNLSAGTYTVTLTDGNGCIKSDSVRITAPSYALSDSILVSSYNGYGISCVGLTNGSASVFTAGGVEPYNVYWSTGDSTATVSNLSAGKYNVTIIDGNGCVKSDSSILTAPPVLLDSISAIKYSGYGVSCAGSSNGKASVYGLGGVAPYNLYWSTGDTTKTVSNLSAGKYTVTIIDGNGCIKSDSVKITQPNQTITTIGSLSNYSGKNISCFGKQDGSAIAQTTGGVAPYTYLWSNGTTSGFAANLSAKTYYTVSKDANGCIDSAFVLLTQPNALIATITSPAILGVYNTSCSLDGDGSCSVTGSGGVAPYAILWNTQTTISTISHLLAGIYTAVLTDKNGCTATKSITLTRPVNCNCITTVPVAPVTCTACTKVLDGQSSVTINTGDNACITNTFAGNINMNGGNLVICGNATLQWLTIPNNSKVTVLGTLTVSGINFNGSNAILENYGSIVINTNLNLAGKIVNNKNITIKQTVNLNAGSSLINNGLINVLSDLTNNGYVENNGSVTVGNTVYNNSGSAMLNNCTTKSRSYFVNSNVRFENNGTLDVTNDIRFNSAKGTVASGSIVRSHDVYLNGTTLSGTGASCALISASSYTQINQATLSGKIALCDANGFEINNSLVLLSGASSACTACQYAGSASPALRESDEENATSTETAGAFNMYPNPVANGMSLTLENAVEIASVTLIDNTGREVLYSTVNEFVISDLNSGIYIVKVQDVLGNLTLTKLVVQ